MGRVKTAPRTSAYHSVMPAILFRFFSPFFYVNILAIQRGTKCSLHLAVSCHVRRILSLVQKREQGLRSCVAAGLCPVRTAQACIRPTSSLGQRIHAAFPLRPASPPPRSPLNTNKLWSITHTDKWSYLRADVADIVVSRP